MGARVLVVDDSPTIRKLVSAILERHNYEPAMVADGHAGLERLRQGDVDLVLLDFVMPRMNGYQFCREMRADDRISHLPVVLMSAKADKIRGQFVQQTGAVDAITKPFDARGLLAVVENALQRAAEGRIRHLDSIPIEEDISITDMEERDSGTIAASEEVAKRDSIAELAKKLADILVATYITLPESRRKDPDEVASALHKAIATSSVEELGPLLTGLDRRGEAGPEGFGGDMAGIPLAEGLQKVQLQRENGTCKITNRKIEVEGSFPERLLGVARRKGGAAQFRPAPS